MLRVQNLWKQQAYFPVSFAETTVEEVTQMVATDINVDAGCVRLIFVGQTLKSGPLSNFGITSDATLYTLVKMRPQEADFSRWQSIADAAGGASPGGKGAAGSSTPAASAAVPPAAPDPCVVDPRWERAPRPFY
jgi:hypothetical protein